MTMTNLYLPSNHGPGDSTRACQRGWEVGGIALTVSNGSTLLLPIPGLFLFLAFETSCLKLKMMSELCALHRTSPWRYYAMALASIDHRGAAREGTLDSLAHKAHEPMRLPTCHSKPATGPALPSTAPQPARQVFFALFHLFTFVQRNACRSP